MLKVVSNIDLSAIERELSAHPFVVPGYLKSYHVQTILSRTAPYFKTTLPQKERIFIKLTDGSQTIADCLFQPDKKNRPTIIVIDGFTRSNTSHFSRSMSHKAFHLGFNVILLMKRAEGDTLHLTKSLFAAYPQHDLPIALEKLSKISSKNMYIAAFSEGGWSTLITLGTMGSKAKAYVSGVALISAASSLLNTWNHIEKYPFYNWYLLQCYKLTVKRRAKIDPLGTWDLQTLKKVRTKREFFEKFYGTHTIGTPEKRITVEEYHTSTDSIKILPKIQTPTLIINSYDDPFVPAKSFSSIMNPNVKTLLTKYGGHGGFYTTKKRYGDMDGLWAENRALEFIRLLEKER